MALIESILNRVYCLSSVQFIKNRKTKMMINKFLKILPNISNHPAAGACTYTCAHPLTEFNTKLKKTLLN